MKSLYLLILAGLFTAFSSYAQNTFPPSGNVGIGTTSPTLGLLHLNGSSGDFLSIYQTNSTQPIQLNAYNNVDFRIIQRSNAAMTLWTNTAERMRIDQNGKVGIGTNNPSAALQIGNFATSSSNQLLIPGTYNFEQVRLGQIANGNTALEFVNHTSTASSYGIRFSVDVDHGAPGLNLQYAPSSPSYETLNYSTGLHLDLSGRVSIGTTVHPAGYKFAVAGNAIAESVTVKLQSAWGDYVFDKNYALKSLPEVKTYIDQNHHLPEMPSAQEVAKDGLNLGEMNRLLVKKVEELTLYLIEMKAEIRELQNQNQLLKTKSN